MLPDADRWQEPLRRTFAELLADVHRYANLLHDLGVRRGDAVALMAPNCAELITATLAAQLAGHRRPAQRRACPGSTSPSCCAAPVPACSSRPGPELAPEHLATPRATLAARRHARRRPRRCGPPRRRPQPAPLPAVDRGRASATSTSSPPARTRPRFVGDPPRSADLAALFHTGGTTGAPKLAAHTHANEVADAWMLAAEPLFDAGDGGVRRAAAVPRQRPASSPCSRRCSRASRWCGPGRSATATRRCTRGSGQIVEHYRIAAMSAVPTVYAALAQVPVDADISSLRAARSSAPRRCPPRSATASSAHTGVRLLEGYGLTEATCASARSFPDAPRPGSVGQRLPYQRMKAVRIGADGTWEDLPAGRDRRAGDQRAHRVPRLRHRPRRARPRPGRAAASWSTAGWTPATSAGVDDDGFVYLTGRAKDLIIRGGHNIDPAIIEDALLAHPQVTAAARGRPARRPRRRGTGRLRHPRRPAPPSTEDELRDWAAERVAEPAAAPKVVTVARRAAGHRRRQAVQAARCAPTPPAAPCSTPSTGSPRHDTVDTPRSRTAPSSPPSRSHPADRRGRRRGASWAATPSPGELAVAAATP